MDIDAGFDDEVLGRGLSPEVLAALQQAARLRDNLTQALSALNLARSLAPEHPAVLIALYRHHFYAHELEQAREVALTALQVGAMRLCLPAHWPQVPDRELAGADVDAAVRFYLFVLKGYAYLSLRMNEPDEARLALGKLRQLDPNDCVGGALLEAVRQRSLVTDDDGESGPALNVFGAAAWARVSAGHQGPAGSERLS